VNTTKINHQGSINEDPAVIVAPECESLAAVVREARVKLHGEPKVMAEGLLVPAISINREERRIFVHIRAACRLHKLHHEAFPVVHRRHILVPLRKAARGMEARPTFPENWFPSRPQLLLNAAAMETESSRPSKVLGGIEVWMRNFEVPDRAIHRQGADYSLGFQGGRQDVATLQQHAIKRASTLVAEAFHGIIR